MVYSILLLKYSNIWISNSNSLVYFMRSYCISNPKIGFEVPILLIHIEERLGLKFGFSKPIFGFELLAGVKLFTTSIPIFGLYIKNFSQ